MRPSDPREGSALIDEPQAAPEAEERDFLWWLRSHDALVRRLVLSQVLGEPRSRRPAWRDLGPEGVRGRLGAFVRPRPGVPPRPGR